MQVGDDLSSVASDLEEDEEDEMLHKSQETYGFVYPSMITYSNIM